MSRAQRLTLRTVISAAIVAVAATLGASPIADPALHFRVLPTEHFRIYFHEGEDEMARRLADIAERTRLALERPLGAVPPRLTHVLLLDQTELANGWATPLPRDTIAIYPVAPAGSDYLGVADDWLRVAFTHEFTHIVHLDRSVGWARGLRRMFGRQPLAFPNLFLPAWQIEGIATYEESALTGLGRAEAGDFGAIVREAGRAGRLEPLDRVNGGLTDWPGGLAQYAYGLGFHQYLADRFGQETLATLVDDTAGRVPFTASRVFTRVYGESLGQLWTDYLASVTAHTAGEPHVEGAATRLTHHGFVTGGPRFDGRGVVYSLRTPHELPSLNRVTLGGASTSDTRLATRYLGDTSAPAPGVIYFDQQEVRRNSGVYSDLYAFDRATRHVRQLTSDARLIDPDLSPDRTTIVCVRNAAGRRDLVLVRLGPVHIDTLITQPDTAFNAPRWSPDGRRIVVERHVLGRLPEVVVVDVQTRSTTVVASFDGARVVTPTWNPNGRSVVAAVAPAREPFNLYEFDITGTTPAVRLTQTTGGATWPDVSPDGNTIVYVGYTPDGFDLFTLPYPHGTPAPFASTAPLAPAEPPAPLAPLEPLEPYSPLPTLAPTSWTPIVTTDQNQIRVGAGVSGGDVLGYHAYAAAATWLASGPAGAAAPDGHSPDWFLSYAYTRWRPVVWVSAASDTSFFAGPVTPTGQPSAATQRETQIQGGVLLPISHVRVSHTGLASVVRATDDLSLPGRTSIARTAVRVGWMTTTAHTFGYSISPERGVKIGMTYESIRRALGSSADAAASTLDARGYLPGLAAHHVVAIRLAAAASTGDADTRRTYHLGGSLTDPGVLSFDRSALSLLRGFPSDTFAGSHVALVNLEYRFPIARPQRGRGTWPFFFHTLHGAVFTDVGQTWTRSLRLSDAKTASGAELAADVVAGYWLRLTATAGIARGHDGSGTVSDRTTAYVRIGKSF